MPNAGNCCVRILLLVFRQQLVAMQVSSRVTGNDIGKSAAAVDPELPSSLHDNLISIWRLLAGFLSKVQYV
jgi:hypothetical protein